MKITLISYAGSLFMWCCAAGCINQQSDSVQHSRPLNSDLAFKSKAEQRKTEERALSGDSDAAIRLATYYSYFEYDFKKAGYWMRLAARLGDQRAVKALKVMKETGEID
jgi:TPR repeat protein